MKRSCGECSACCTVVGVDDLPTPKGTWTRCDHERAGGGCSIYAERPRSCRRYQCAWLLGLGSDADRPDRIGIVADPWRPPDGGELGLHLREVWPGAATDVAIHRLLGPLHAVMEGLVAVVVQQGRHPRRVIGDVARLRRIAAAVQSSA